MRKKFFAFGIAAMFLFSLVATVGAYSTGFKPNIDRGYVRIVKVPDLSKFPVATPKYIINPEDKYPKIIDEKTIIPAPEPEPEPTPEPTPVEEDPHEMDFWKWIEEYDINNRLCPFKPIDISLPKLCPFGTFDTGDWRMFPY